MSGLAVVTGASSGIGLELARCCAADGYDLVICSHGPRIAEAATDLAGRPRSVSAVRADLGTAEGVDRLMAEIGEREIDVLVANAGIGCGGAFLDVELADALRVVEVNVLGTLILLHKAGRRMRDRGAGRILVTGSIAGFALGSYHAVYNASKAFLNNFAYALGDELRGNGVTVTVLIPGATETRFFDRAGLEKSRLGSGSRQTRPRSPGRLPRDDARPEGCRPRHHEPGLGGAGKRRPRPSAGPDPPRPGEARRSLIRRSSRRFARSRRALSRQKPLDNRGRFS